MLRMASVCMTAATFIQTTLHYRTCSRCRITHLGGRYEAESGGAGSVIGTLGCPIKALESVKLAQAAYKLQEYLFIRKFENGCCTTI